MGQELANYHTLLVFQVQGLPRPSSLPSALRLHAAVLACLSSTAGFHYCIRGQWPFRWQGCLFLCFDKNNKMKQISLWSFFIGLIYDGSCWGFPVSFCYLYCAVYSQICFLNSHRYLGILTKWGMQHFESCNSDLQRGEIMKLLVIFWVLALVSWLGWEASCWLVCEEGVKEHEKKRWNLNNWKIKIVEVTVFKHLDFFLNFLKIPFICPEWLASQRWWWWKGFNTFANVHNISTYCQDLRNL